MASNARSSSLGAVLHKIGKLPFLLRSVPAMFLMLVILMAVFADFIAPFDPS